MGADDDKMLIDKTLLRELELQLQESKKKIEQHLRIIALLRGGGPKEKPVVTPLASPTGRKSRCVELSKKK